MIDDWLGGYRRGGPGAWGRLLPGDCPLPRSPVEGRWPTDNTIVITVEIHDDQSHVPVDHRRLQEAVRGILEDHGVGRAQISLALVDDRTVRRLHHRYLNDDAATDVLSFALERSEDSLEGEVVVSAEMARRTAQRLGWPAEDELLLYVVHGTLHLVGYDDATPEQRAEMGRRERAYLGRLGVDAGEEDSEVPGGTASGGNPLP